MSSSPSVGMLLLALPVWFGPLSPPAPAQEPPPQKSPPAKSPPLKSPEEQRASEIAYWAHEARDHSDKYRLTAWEKLLEFGDDGRRALRPIVAAKLERDRASLEERFKGAELARARKKAEAALVERRKVALECIFDSKRYPDEDHGVVGQPEVDKHVQLVASVWDHPASFTRQTIPDVDAVARALEDDLVYLEASGGTAPSDMPTVAGWLDGFDADFGRESFGITDSHQNWNAEVAKYHAEELLTSADEGELECMNATNAYRSMMGLRIVEIDERLVRAARRHSQEMVELRYFAHESPVAENRSPGMRCSREGYSGAGSENIAAGNSTGESAFRAWYYSSGHHRNMLGGHQQIGVGRCDELWTQNFGGSSSLRGRKIDDPQMLYLGRLKKLDATSFDGEFTLALWCKGQKLMEPAKLHASRALALDPGNEKARALAIELETPPPPPKEL